MFTGLDVDKATISVAVAQGKRGGEVRHRTVPHRPDQVRKFVEKLAVSGSGYILAMKQTLAATACTGTSSNLGSSIGGADLAPRMDRCWESRGCRQAPLGCRACRRLRRRQRRHEAQGVG